MTTARRSGEPAAGRPLRADARRNRARVLEAAEAVFTARGVAASTEEIARVAGVGIGTVFRHFPTKKDLLTAIMRERLERVFARAGALAAGDDPAGALFTFFTWMVEQSAAKKTVMEAMDQVGIEPPRPMEEFERAVGVLLTGAQRAGAVRDDVALPEVMALLLGTCQAAMRAGWDERLRERTLSIIFAGLDPPAVRPGGRRRPAPAP